MGVETHHTATVKWKLYQDFQEVPKVETITISSDIYWNLIENIQFDTYLLKDNLKHPTCSGVSGSDKAGMEYPRLDGSICDGICSFNESATGS